MRGRKEGKTTGVYSQSSFLLSGHIRRMPRQSQAAKQRSDMSAWLIAWEGHAWTRLVPDDVSWLTIGWEQDWAHTANAATCARPKGGCMSAWLIASRYFLWKSLHNKHSERVGHKKLNLEFIHNAVGHR